MDLQFRDLTIEDRDLVNKFTCTRSMRGWEFCFAMIWSWNVFESTKVCVMDDMVIVYTKFYNKIVFFPPFILNLKLTNKAFDLIQQHCKQLGVEMIVNGVPKEYIDNLDAQRYEFVSDRDNYDYIYSTDDLINLVGKKFHAKRNFVSRFAATYEFKFCEYTAEDYNGIMELCSEWNQAAAHETLDLEFKAIDRALKNYEQLNIRTGLIKVDGKIIAFSINNITCDNAHTFFEKADRNFIGAYQTINKYVAENFLSGVKFVNRQEDMGIEGLRKVKLSYNPVSLLEKYKVGIKA